MLNFILRRSTNLIPRYCSFNYTAKLLISTSSYQNYPKVPVPSEKHLPKTPFIDPDYQVIYRYPGIEGIRSLSRLKIYSFLITLVLPPVTYIAEYHQLLEENAALAMALLSASLTVSTTLVGILLKDFVGIIYYNDKKDIVKIASLSYTGRRNDDYIPRTHLTPYKTWKVCPILSKFKDDQGKKEYKIIANNGIKEPMTYNFIFSSQEEELESDPKSTLPPKSSNSSTDDVDVEELIKKVQSQNKKNVKQ